MNKKTLHTIHFYLLLFSLIWSISTYGQGDLFISEYVEGSFGLNKCIEI